MNYCLVEVKTNFVTYMLNELKGNEKYILVLKFSVFAKTEQIFINNSILATCFYMFIIKFFRELYFK